MLSGPVGLRGLILTFLVGVGAASLGACLLPCPAHFQLCFESALSVGEGSPGSVPDACLFILSRGLLRCRSPCCGSCPAPHHCPGTGPWRLALLCARTERWFLLLLDRMPSLLHALFCTPGASLLKGSRAGRQGEEGNPAGLSSCSGGPLRQTQRSPEGPRHLHRIPRLSEAQEGCQGPSRPSGRNRGLPLRRRRGQGPKRTGEGPKPHPHDSTLGESSREAQSGRRLLGTNGVSLWLWCCLSKPGALGP